jgi:hypothetical protein
MEHSRKHVLGRKPDEHEKENPMHASTRKRRPPRGGALALALPFAVLTGAPALAGEEDRVATVEELTRVRVSLEARGYSDVHDLDVDEGASRWTPATGTGSRSTSSSI